VKVKLQVASMFQHMPGSLQQMYSSQHSQQSQYHTQANAFPSQQEVNNNWTKISYKRGRSAQDETEAKTKHSKESEHWLNQTSTPNRYTVLLKEESEDQWHKRALRIHSTRSNICSNNQTKFICSHKYRAKATHKPTS
jgi:hypothetical protein